MNFNSLRFLQVQLFAATSRTSERWWVDDNYCYFFRVHALPPQKFLISIVSAVGWTCMCMCGATSLSVRLLPAVRIFSALKCFVAKHFLRTENVTKCQLWETNKKHSTELERCSWNEFLSMSRACACVWICWLILFLAGTQISKTLVVCIWCVTGITVLVTGNVFISQFPSGLLQRLVKCSPFLLF